MEQVKVLLENQGRRPYLIPVGGSSSIGAAGYFEAAYELKSQMSRHSCGYDRIVFATSSGGTQAGLTLGLKAAEVDSELLAISIDQVPEIDAAIGMTYQQFVLDIAQDLERRLGLSTAVTLTDFPIEYGYLGNGYGVVGDLERHAIYRLAQSEGLLVDPVYSGRAFGALLDMVSKGQIKAGESVLFWHTGGEAALFAYGDEFVGQTGLRK
jgi:D-cysteine desulfhydrase